MDRGDATCFMFFWLTGSKRPKRLSPSIPGRMGLLQGRKAVCFPGFESYLTGASIPDKPVVSDGCFITARGAGCAFLFAHAIIERLRGKETADRILAEIQYAC